MTDQPQNKKALEGVTDHLADEAADNGTEAESSNDKRAAAEQKVNDDREEGSPKP